MYKGELKNFPKEVVEKMLERQVEQGNKRDVSVFEKNRTYDKNGGGFYWVNTIEGSNFWEDVIRNKNFNVFFQKYPKKPEYPKVMWVSDSGENWDWVKRVVFMKKNGKYLAWTDAETLKQSEKHLETAAWNHAKDIEEQPSIEINVKINGKKAKLSDISDDTLKRLKELE